MTITHEEMQQLTRPFAVDEHLLREGSVKDNGVQWLVYLDKIAVINRLNEVFGGEWGNTMETRQLDSGVVVVDCHITIRGVTRGLNGADSQSFNKHDIAKSAGSDALKRAFTVWGGGLYLYKSPFLWTQGSIKNSNGKTDYKERDRHYKIAWGKFSEWLTNSVLRPISHEATSNNKQQNTNELWWSDGTLLNNIITGAKNNDLTLFYLEMAVGQSMTSFETYDNAIDAIKNVMAQNSDMIKFATTRYYNQSMDKQIKSQFNALKHFTNWLDKHYNELELHEAVDLLTFESNVFNLLKKKSEAK